jgi:hypothetical protein
LRTTSAQVGEESKAHLPFLLHEPSLEAEVRLPPLLLRPSILGMPYFAGLAVFLSGILEGDLVCFKLVG